MRVERLQVVETHRLDGNLHDVLLGNTRRALLLFKEVLAGIDERLLRHQTDNLGSRHPDATSCGSAAHLIEGHMQWSHVQIGHVHRHLGNAIFVDKPADGLRSLQRSRLHDGVSLGILQRFAREQSALTHGTTLLAHVECNRVGTASRGGIQVVVHCDEEVAGTHSRTTRAGYALVEGTCSVVRSLLSHSEFLGQCLILACTADGQVLPLRLEGSSLVAIARNASLVGQSLRQLSGQLGTLLKRDATDGDERQHIGSAHARMSTMMQPHVDELSGTLHRVEGSLAHLLRRAHEGHHRAVCSIARVHIKQFHSFVFLNLVGDLLNHIHVASLAEVRHALNNLCLFAHKYINDLKIGDTPFLPCCYALNLDQCAFRQILHGEGAASRIGLAEEGAVNLIHCNEVGDVGQQHGGLHYIAEFEASLTQDCLCVEQRLACLFLDASFGEGSRCGVNGQLP